MGPAKWRGPTLVLAQLLSPLIPTAHHKRISQPLQKLRRQIIGVGKQSHLLQGERNSLLQQLVFFHDVSWSVQRAVINVKDLSWKLRV